MPLYRPASLFVDSNGNPPAGGGGGQTRTRAQITNTDITTNINTTAWTTVPLAGTPDVIDSEFVLSGQGIQCNFDGWVKVTAHVGMSGSVGRANVAIRLSVGGTPHGAQGKSSYIRNSAGHNESSSDIPGVDIEVTNGQVITLESFREAVTGTVIMDNAGCYLLVERWS